MVAMKSIQWPEVHQTTMRSTRWLTPLDVGVRIPGLAGTLVVPLKSPEGVCKGVRDVGVGGHCQRR